MSADTRPTSEEEEGEEEGEARSTSVRAASTAALKSATAVEESP